ncbi:MAG: aspartyl/asparaginyl beta-hydroxylase domain-containing protein [Cyanobacteria bacterium P01_F01_bin.143]
MLKTHPKQAKRQVMSEKTKTVRELGAVDISQIQEDILNLPVEVWQGAGSNKPNNVFKPLKSTEHIIFTFVNNFDNHLDVVEYPIWQEWKSRLEPIMEAATKPYGYEKGGFSRVMLAKLLPHSKIPLHIDMFKSANNTHKIHIPIQTSPDVTFIVGYKKYHFPEGYAYEVNNAGVHGGINAGDTPRIHLIIEYFQRK